MGNQYGLGHLLQACSICPRRCGVNRVAGHGGYCGQSAGVRVARSALHMWEEPPISGTRGSGTIFFSGCNLRCVFCQNAPISQMNFGAPVSSQALCAMMLDLQSQGAHNINLVSATQFTPQVAEAIDLAHRDGLTLPVVWNSNAYELPETLALLDGLVDAYLPDLKYAGDEPAVAYSDAPGYFEHATRAIAEMFRQVGAPRFEDDLLTSGLIVRHLLLPGQLEDTKQVLDWVAASLPKSVYVSIMSQYTPLHRAGDFPAINRRITARHAASALDYFEALGLTNGFTQDIESADAGYVPPFDLTGVGSGS